MSEKERQELEQSLFEQVLELDSEAERISFLKGACGKDSEFFHRMVDLIAAHSGENNFIRTVDRDLDPTAEDRSSWEGPGCVIGRYKLLQQIGEGGMGVVYMAQQEEPVQRKVALKIIKVGMDTKHVVARFEAERQALAMMDHPNIAKVLDGGATESGRPYFVMELVQGVPITEFCDKNNLSLIERLELFMPLCRAIHSAHRKGIIHRDIKPSNVLVTLHHGEPMSKVIDFGIAKATNQKLTEKTLFTQYSHMIGTPAYMSPEQAEMSSMDVDTRSDIYSLGVLLYELLTGTTPFSVDRLKELAYGEIQRVIAEEEPQMPSTRMSTMEDVAKTAVAKRRSIDVQTLSKQFKGDIDWIVMKCLEKDRRRRYETPSELVADLQCYLNSEPVSAAAPSVVYQLQKLTRRHKTAFTAAAAVLAMFLLGSTIATWQAIRATKAQHKAEAAERITQTLLDQELGLRSETDRARNEAEALKNEAKALRNEAYRKLYRSLMDQARLARHSKKPGFRAEVESFVKQAASLDTEVANPYEMRNEAVSAMVASMSAGSTRVAVNFAPRLGQFTPRFNVPFDDFGVLDEKGVLSIHQLVLDQQTHAPISLDTEPITNFVFSHDGTILMTGHSSGTIRAWNRESASSWVISNEVSALDQGEPVENRWGDLAVGNHGFALLPIASQQLLLWQNILDQSPQKHQLPASCERTQGSQFSLSPDGRWVVIPNLKESNVVIWDTQTKRVIKKMTFQRTRFKRNAIYSGFSPDGRYLALGTNSSIEVLETTHFETVYQQAESGLHGSFCFSPDSEQLVFGQNRVHLVHIESAKTIETLDGTSGLFVFSGRNPGLYRLHIHDSHFGSTVEYWPLGSTELIQLTGHLSPVREIVFHPEKPIVVTGSFDRSVRFWDLDNSNKPPKTIENLAEVPSDFMFSPDQRFFAMALRDDNGTVTFREADSLKVVHEFELGARAYSVAFDRSGSFFAVGGKDKIKVWSVEESASALNEFPYQFNPVWEHSQKGMGWVSEVKFSPQGRYLAFNPGVEEQVPKEEVLVVDLETRSELPVRLETNTQWRTFDFVNDSQLALVGPSHKIEIWNFLDGKQDNVIQSEPFDRTINWLAVSESGRYIAYLNFPDYVGVYDFEIGKHLFCVPTLGAGGGGAIRWSADEKRLGISLGSGQAIVLNFALIRERLVELDLGVN